MKILVTGCDGYTGSVLVTHLVERGYQVIGLDTRYYKDCNLYNDQNEIDIIEKDIRDINSINFQSIDAIIHLAALSNDPLGFLNPDITMEINFKSSVKLAKLAKKNKIEKFIFASSCSGYGINKIGMVNEDSLLNPLTTYAKSKVLTEHEISKLGSKQFIPVFLRSATVYGGSPKLRFDLVINNLVGSALTIGKIIINSDGTPWRPTLHIEDECTAFMTILEAENDLVNNKIYNVGSTDENYKIKDIADIIKKHIECEIKYLNQEPDSRSYRVNCDKIKKELGFKSNWTLKKGIKELIKTLTDLRINFSEFNSRKYTRLKQIKYLLEKNKLNEKLKWKIE